MINQTKAVFLMMFFIIIITTFVCIICLYVNTRAALSIITIMLIIFSIIIINLFVNYGFFEDTRFRNSSISTICSNDDIENFNNIQVNSYGTSSNVRNVSEHYVSFSNISPSTFTSRTPQTPININTNIYITPNFSALYGFYINTETIMINFRDSHESFSSDDYINTSEIYNNSNIIV